MPAKTAVRTRHLMRRLNIFGLDHLDPVILAALADERPLLLVGAHGTAKSELLNRLAAVLGLEHRHFNASLISFDDLLGYPLPDESRTGLVYLRTPGDLWGAESVFLDEISRCRPETQNKLFSIIHEKRVQGLPLDNLRYRWAAMNPPVALDGDPGDGQDAYLGSLPLDPALADRFPWVVAVPRLEDMSVKDRRLLLADGGDRPEDDGVVGDLVGRTRAKLASAAAAGAGDWIAAYVDGLIAPLHEAGLTVSGRRAISLCRSVAAVRAACLALGRKADLPGAAFLALKWGLPHRALGRRIDEPALRAIHRLAAKSAAAHENSPWRSIRGVVDPVRRVAAALAHPDGAVERLEMSQLVLDAIAAQEPAHRPALALNLLPVFSERDLLTAIAFEELANLASPVLEFTEAGEQTILAHRNRAGEWDRVLATVTRLEKSGAPDLPETGNLLFALFAAELGAFDPDEVIGRYRQWRSLFRRTRARGRARAPPAAARGPPPGGAGGPGAGAGAGAEEAA